MGLQQITGNEIAAGSIAATDLASASITGDKLGATSINANNIVGGTITTTQIASNTISNTNIQTGAIENYSRATGLLSGMRNRIINGAMVFDQRNAGASVTITTDGTYTLDRWVAGRSQSSKFSVQQDSSANTVAGFTSSLKVTSLSSYSITSTDFFVISQYIEGLNSIADLNWGTANAKTVTLSFYVRSSLTGTFGGSLQNSSYNRSYPFTYTISVANTWEQKTITIAGDTSGTWLATNGIGIVVNFGLGIGSTYSGTAGAWAGSNFFSATGATSVVGTNGATFYITGVQLEVGSTATSFDYRPYTTELQLCQRYFQKRQLGFNGVGGTGAIVYMQASLPVAMRANPAYSATGAIQITDIYAADYTQSSTQIQVWQSLSSDVPVTVASVSMGNFSGLTQGRTYFLSTSQSIFLSSEL